MKKVLIVALMVVASTAQATSIDSAQRMIDNNFDTQDCGKVIKVANRNGGGEVAVCSNKEAFMLTGNSKMPLMKCSVLDKYRAKGIDLGVSTRECRGGV